MDRNYYSFTTRWRVKSTVGEVYDILSKAMNQGKKSLLREIMRQKLIEAQR